MQNPWSWSEQHFSMRGDESVSLPDRDEAEDKRGVASGDFDPSGTTIDGNGGMNKIGSLQSIELRDYPHPKSAKSSSAGAASPRPQIETIRGVT